MKKGEKMQKDKNRTVKIRFKLTKMQETIDEMSKVVYNSNQCGDVTRVFKKEWRNPAMTAYKDLSKEELLELKKRYRCGCSCCRG